jgi:predicted metal-dependent hydrolase
MFVLILILIILLSVIYINFRENYENDNMIYIKSSVDGRKYWVRNLPDKENSANTLAKIRENIVKLVNYLKKNSDKFPKKLSYIKNLVKRTKVINIMETPKDDKFTSYTVNKGEKIVFCLRHKTINTIHDMNTLMYVVIHELAHVGCPEHGHTPLFKKIFKFLLKQSVQIGIYIPVNYIKNPQNYCGMVINEYLFR